MPKLELFVEAIEAANEAPAAGNLKPITFILVTDPEKIATIAQACQQSFIAKAPVVVVVTSNVKQIEKLYEEKAHKYLKQNVGAAIQTFTLQLAESGISTCLVAPFSDFTIQNAIAIPDGNEIEMVITAGEGMGETVRKKSPSLINKIFYNNWGNKWSAGGQPEVTRKDM